MKLNSQTICRATIHKSKDLELSQIAETAVGEGSLKVNFEILIGMHMVKIIYALHRSIQRTHHVYFQWLLQDRYTLCGYQRMA